MLQNHLILPADVSNPNRLMHVKLFWTWMTTLYLRFLMETPDEMFILYSCRWKLSMGFISPKFSFPKVKSQSLR